MLDAHHRLAARLLPDWFQDRRPDASHFHRRRLTRAYRAKRRWVRDCWIGAGLLMVLNPHPGFIASVALATTLLSFALLDETP